MSDCKGSCGDCRCGESAAQESVLDEAARLVAGARGADYGEPIDNHGTTAELVTAYLKRRYPLIWAEFPGFGLDAEDVCWINILQKCSRDANQPKRDNSVDVAGYAENLQRVRDERARRAF